MNRLAASLLALSLLTGCPVDDDDDAAQDSCDLLAGDVSPEVVIQDPSNSLMADADEAINWIVHIEDEDSEVTDIELEAMDMSSSGTVFRNGEAFSVIDVDHHDDDEESINPLEEQ